MYYLESNAVLTKDHLLMVVLVWEGSELFRDMGALETPTYDIR